METKVATMNLTKEGGMAVVMVGHNGWIDEYSSHPQIKFIDSKKVQTGEMEAVVPTNTKVVIITEGMPQYPYQWIMAFARRKSIPFLLRKTNPAIKATLDDFFPRDTKGVTQGEAKESFVKGKLNDLVPHIDFSKSNADNGRDLLRIANEKGIKTTLGSLTQLVANKRRASGQTPERPKSARPKLDLFVDMFDKAIEDMKSMRDFVIETTEENRILKDKLDKVTKALAVIK